MAENILLIQENSRGYVKLKICPAQAKRGLASGQYVKEYIRDASGRVKGSQLREKYVAPSDSRDSDTCLTLHDMRANVGETGNYGTRMRAKRKISAWHELTVQFRQVVTL